MSAGGSLQAAILQALRALPDLGVYDAPPTRAAYPYATVDCGSEWDWSHNTADGREVGVAVTLWDDEPPRLEQVADPVLRQVSLVKDVPGWLLVNLRFTRKRIIRDPTGPWAMALDFRAPLLSTIEGD